MRFRFLKEEYLIETIADVKKYYPTITDKDFNRIIALDPTFNKEKDKVGTYGKWLLNLFKANKLDNEGHVKDLLTRFEDNKKQLKNKDIMSYKSLTDVEDALNDTDSYNELSGRQQLRQTQKAVRDTKLNEDARLVYEDSDWEVWVPETYEASCKLGQGSRWCTASTSNDYYFNFYKDNYGGNYYIVINKHDNEEKYQFHFESNQFMDKNDVEVNLSIFMSENDGLKNFFTPICEKALISEYGNLEDALAQQDDSFIIPAERIAKECETRDMSAKFIESCFDDTFYDYWESYDYTDSEGAEYALKNYLDDSTKQHVIDLGYNLDEPNYDLINCARMAADNAETVGAQGECLKDYHSAMENAVAKLKEDFGDIEVAREFPFGNKNSWDGTGDFIFILNKNTKPDIFKIAQKGRDDDDTYYDIIYSFAEGFDFVEPYSGWYGFDEETFNDYIMDFLEPNTEDEDEED